MKSYFVYVILDNTGNRHYTGMTNDLTRRFKEHNSGKTKSTKALRPWRLIYSEKYFTQAEALEREKYFKSGIGREFVKRLSINM